MKMSLRKKLILILILFSVVPTSTIVLIEINRDQKTLKEQIGISSLEFARLAMKRICEYINEKQVDVQRLAKNMGLQCIGNYNKNDTLNQYLTNLRQDYDEFAYVNYLDTKGVIVASSNVKLTGSDMSSNSGYNSALDGNDTIQDVVFDEIAEEFTLIIFVPIKNVTEQAEVVGVISASLKWEKVNEMIAGLDVKGERQNMANHIMLTNKDGLVISCFEPAQMFSTNLFDMGLKSFQYARKNKEGYLIETSEHDLTSFSTYTYLKKDEYKLYFDWYLILYQDSESIFAPIHELKNTMLYILIFTSIFLIITSFLFANKISKPILTLALMAQAIGRGDLKKTIKIKSRDEIGYLANTFDIMRQELDKSFKNVEKHRKELLLLSNRILLVQEEERKNLSRDLHDHFGQALVALKTNLEIISKLIPKDNKKAHEWLMNSKHLLLKTMEEIRNLAFHIRPAMLDELGLEPTIESYTKDFSARTNITVEVRTNIKTRRFQPDIELSIYRMAQEALTNVVKHAEASNVNIEIRFEAPKLTISIKDNGKGFDIKKVLNESANECGIGLLGMRERFASIGGTFEVFSDLGQGTKLLASCYKVETSNII